jgi:tetratricopeptide (TPR) repeat protein
MERRELLERYEALGNEDDFLAARSLYEQALAETSDAQMLGEYGYLLECQGRNTIRRAVEHYERAIELDSSVDKLHYQLISARAALFDTDEAITLYSERLAAFPESVREYRFLTSAYLAAHEYGRADTVIAAGLERAPNDRVLIAHRGDVKGGTGDPNGALADWRLALELDPEDIGPAYSTAFLLEREQRLEEAIETWRFIVAWNESRGYSLQSDWPKRELERLRRGVVEE